MHFFFSTELCCAILFALNLSFSIAADVYWALTFQTHCLHFATVTSCSSV